MVTFVLCVISFSLGMITEIILIVIHEKRTVTYEKVSFNIEVIRKFQSAQEFINHKSYQHLWPGLSEEKRKERLKELYELCAQ